MATPFHPHPRLLGWRTVVVCVMVGVVVNVGVAWGLAVWVQVRGGTPDVEMLIRADSGQVEFLDGFYEQQRLVPTLEWPHSGLGQPADLPDCLLRRAWPGCVLTIWGELSEFHCVLGMESGLPMSSAVWFGGVREPPSQADTWALDTGLTVNPSFGTVRWGWTTAHLPLRPVLPGFFVNTIFYTALVFAPVVGARVVRRRRWAKRGRCIACGYELGGIAVCPECGLGPAV